MSLESVLSELRQFSTSEREKGSLFEKFIAKYLKTDPQYSRLENVWLWSGWPYNWGQDDGIDLVAQDRDTGDFWAIQCKFFDSKKQIDKKDIDSFFTASGKMFSTPEGQRQFSQRLIVSTTDHWSSLAESALADQTIPTIRLRLKDLEESPVDWDSFSLTAIDKMSLRTRKALRDHQKDAVKEILAGFEEVDRGKLVMACGTGKTFTSLRGMEKLVPDSGVVLFLAPSISLVGQTLREWTADAEDPFRAFVICSDSKVGKDNEDIRSFDLAYPSTTDANQIFKIFERIPKDSRRVVVFSTYQSIDVVAELQSLGFPQFDLVVCDEAHRTTGLTLEAEEESHFVKVHDNRFVLGKKRLYMTATPRIYGDSTKKKAGEKMATLVSMDDESIYGPEFYNLPFGHAVELNLLSDYKVVLVAVDNAEMAALANEANAAMGLDEKKGIDTDFAIKIVGSWKGLSKSSLFLLGEDGSQEQVLNEQPMRRAIAFSNSIKDSKTATEAFTKIVDLYTQKSGSLETDHLVNCELEHVDGSMNAVLRKSYLDWLKADSDSCRILSNARCLSEGIDVPALDAVIFLDTRDSIVDIVQSVGRVMRKAPGKTYGYIILPVGIPMDEIKDYSSFIETDKRFKGIWKIIRSLRAHDESLVDEAEFQKKIKVAILKPGGKSREKIGKLDIEIPNFTPVTELSRAVYTAIPKKLGDREYWADWARDVAQIAGRVILRIGRLVEESDAAKDEFSEFLAGLRENINAEISQDDAVEMLAQHLITRPVFDAIFDGYEFSKHNPVAKAMDRVLTVLDRHQIDSETESMQRFYDSIRDRVRYAKSDKSRQDIIRNLYDTFFQSAFPKMSDRLGIVYTPVEVVDFILRSANVALKENFGKSLGDEGVQILDPFTGTGTFIVRLLQLGLISPEDLIRKFATEIHANEIVLLAYYIAAINIETTYHSLTGEYKPFPGIVLTDTFQLSKKDALQSLNPVLPENNERVRHQVNQDIRVIVGNPPYSAGQGSANDDNQNTKYKELDERIRQTYVKESNSANKNSLYDSYIKALRWASDRIGDSGIISFVTNGAFIDSNTADGLRKCLAQEFSHIYVFNLRGNQRTSGELSRQEGGKIFGSGSRTPVSITVMVKNPKNKNSSKISYHDIGDYLNREEKLSIIENFKDVSSVPWADLMPNEHGDWINQRNPEFENFIQLGDKVDKSPTVIFSVYSCGIQSNRDAWVYNFSKNNVLSNMNRMVENYNNIANGSYFGDKNSKLSISWTSKLLLDSEKGIHHNFFDDTRESIYRPFVKNILFFSKVFNHRPYQIPKIFPTKYHRNIIIAATGVGATKSFSSLATDQIPDLEVISKSQCYPLYWYSKTVNEITASLAGADEHGYVRHDAITDWALETFQQHYKDDGITKEDIFWYVYGILSSTEYKTKYGADLKKMLPRIPFAQDFWAFSKAGKELGELHLNYETVEPYPLEEKASALLMGAEAFKVQKMVFPKKDGKPDKTKIVYSPKLTLSGIPLEAYDYVVNGKSALEWIMDRYQVKQDKDSNIINDPNKWCEEHENPRYIVDLIKRIVTVSLKTNEIVKGLPKI